MDDTRGRLHLTRLLTLYDAVIGHDENAVVVTGNQALHVAMFIVCDIPTVLHCLDLLAIPFMETLKTEINIYNLEVITEIFIQIFFLIFKIFQKI